MYVSISVKTLGQELYLSSVIEFGAVVDNFVDPIEKLPKYHCYITSDRYSGEPICMADYSRSLRNIAKRVPDYSFVPEDLLGTNFKNWLRTNNTGNFIHSPYIPASINAVFRNTKDKEFAEALPGFKDNVKICPQLISPWTFFYDPVKSETVPDADSCLKRLGIFNHEKDRNSCDEAMDMVFCMRHIFKNKVVSQ